MNLKFDHFFYKTNLNEYLKLFKESFPEVIDTSEEGYHWLMHSFPGEEFNSFEYYAHIGEEMVGFYAAIPYSYMIYNKKILIGMVCGVMTSPKYRGKGIFTKLGEYSLSELKNHVSFTTGFPIRKEVIPGHLKVGWEIAFHLPLYIKFLKTNSLLKENAKCFTFLTPILNYFILLYNKKGKKKFKTSNYKVDITNKLTNYEDILNFEEKWINSIPICLIRDEKFLRWRYNRPGSSYKFITIKKDDEICGFCSFRRIIRKGVLSYGILDLRIIEKDKIALHLIYNSLEQEAQKENVEAILVMISKEFSKRYKLLKYGFLKSPFKFQFIINDLANDFNKNFLFNERNWHLMWVDSDDL